MHQTHASSVYGESSIIWVKDSDSVGDRVKVRVTSVVLVTARVRYRNVTRHRCIRRWRTHQTHFARNPQSSPQHCSGRRSSNEADPAFKML